MSVFKYVSLFAAFTIAFSGCVSKKKYLEMEASKNKFQTESKKLKSENTTLQNSLKESERDFKAMKDFFAASDAAKNDELEKLQLDLAKIEDSYNVMKADLNKTQDLFKDQRYFNAKSSSEIARLDMEVKQLARDTTSLNYSIKLTRQRVDEYKKRNSEQLDQLDEKNKEIKALNTKINGKDNELKTLQANVVAEQKKIKDINDAFIELRKQLVRAKGAGTPIDPNGNTNIDKISNTLGHY